MTPLNAEVMRLIWIALPLAAFGFVADFLYDSQQVDEVAITGIQSRIDSNFKPFLLQMSSER